MVAVLATRLKLTALIARVLKSLRFGNSCPTLNVKSKKIANFEFRNVRNEIVW